jgi:hypothetical protein
LINREGKGGDRSYQYAVQQFDDRDKPFKVAMLASLWDVAKENTTFRYYAEAEEAGRVYCDLHCIELNNLVIASIDVVYHKVKE